MTEITEWRSYQTKTIYLTQNLFAEPFRVDVRQFIPTDGDVLERRWADCNLGIKKCRRVPAYAIGSMRDAGEEIRRYLDHNAPHCISSLLRDSDDFIFSTFLKALKASESAEVNPSASSSLFTLRMANRTCRRKRSDCP
jgi:hypothetical protein